MPQPIIWNDKCYVDYYGELQLKSRFQLDLYVRGLNCIPKVFLNEDEPLGKEYKAGVLQVDKGRYFDVENRIKKCFQHPDYSAKKIQYIYKTLNQLKIENELIENTYSLMGTSINHPEGVRLLITLRKSRAEPNLFEFCRDVATFRRYYINHQIFFKIFFITFRNKMLYP